MERQVVIELAGGISEAIYRGERRRDKVLAFARAHCCMDVDLEMGEVCAWRSQAADAGYPFEPRDFVGRALDMLTEHWPEVEAVAMALLDQGRVEGERVEEIVVEAMADRFDAMRPLARKTKASR